MAEKDQSPEDLALQWMVQGLLTLTAGLVTHMFFPKERKRH